MGSRVTPLMFNPESSFSALALFYLFFQFFSYMCYDRAFPKTSEYFFVVFVIISPEYSFDVFHTHHILKKVLILKKKAECAFNIIIVFFQNEGIQFYKHMSYKLLLQCTK